MTNIQEIVNQIIEGRRFMSSSNDTQKKRKDLIIKMIKEMPEKNIQKCLQVFSALYVGSNMLQMKKGYNS